jgi:hypothetical protein
VFFTHVEKENEEKQFLHPMFVHICPHDHIGDPSSYIMDCWESLLYVTVHTSHGFSCSQSPSSYYMFIKCVSRFSFEKEVYCASAQLGDVHFFPLTGSERWSISSPCSVFIWFCNYSTHCSCQGSYIPSYKEAGKYLCNVYMVRIVFFKKI